jgi:hypothetical protein
VEAARFVGQAQEALTHLHGFVFEVIDLGFSGHGIAPFRD